MAARLDLALADGALALPEAGRILVVAPPAGHDLSALPADRVVIAQRMAPDHAAWARAGYDTVVTPEGDFAAAIVIAGRFKDATRADIAMAAALLPVGAPLVVDGQKTDGIESLLKALRRDHAIGGVISKHHGKLFWFPAAPMPGWAAADQLVEGGFVTRPGVFSADGPDRGSRLLADTLPARLPAAVAEFGAGWGFLARAILSRGGVETLDLYEADHVALDCARRNVTDPRARFHWADVTTLDAGPFDAIVMNPPFHAGRAGDPDLGRAFIAAAAQALRPSGRLWLVANRHLPYERALDAHFAEVAELGGDSGFKVMAAARPRRAAVRKVAHR